MASAFAIIDADGNGFITADELLQHLLAAGQEPETIAELFQTIDTSKDGKISLEEWTAAMDGGQIAAELPLPPGLLERIFGAIDTSGNGTLSRAEIEGFATLLGQTTADDAAQAAIAAFNGGLDELFRGGLDTSVPKATFVAYQPKADASLLEAFSQLASAALQDGEGLTTMLDELHIQRSNSGALGAGALDAGAPAKGVERMRKMFSEVDADGDGGISKQELADMWVMLEQEQVDELFTKADTNNNGIISFDEFLAAAESFENAEKSGLDALDDLLP